MPKTTLFTSIEPPFHDRAVVSPIRRRLRHLINDLRWEGRSNLDLDVNVSSESESLDFDDCGGCMLIEPAQAHRLEAWPSPVTLLVSSHLVNCSAGTSRQSVPA